MNETPLEKEWNAKMDARATAKTQRGREAVRAISEIGWALGVLAPGSEPGLGGDYEGASAAIIATYAASALRERDELRALLRRVHVAAFGEGGFCGKDGKRTFEDAVEHFEGVAGSAAEEATAPALTTTAERDALDAIAKILGVRPERPEDLVHEVEHLAGAAAKAGSVMLGDEAKDREIRTLVAENARYRQLLRDPRLTGSGATAFLEHVVAVQEEGARQEVAADLGIAGIPPAHPLALRFGRDVGHIAAWMLEARSEARRIEGAPGDRRISWSRLENPSSFHPHDDLGDKR